MRNYPINFVVKHPNRFVFLRTARPEAVRNLPARSEDLTFLFPDRRHALIKQSRSNMAAIWKQLNEFWWS